MIFYQLYVAGILFVFEVSPVSCDLQSLFQLVSLFFCWLSNFFASGLWETSENIELELILESQQEK